MSETICLIDVYDEVIFLEQFQSDLDVNLLCI